MFTSWFNTKSGIVSNKIGFEDVIYAIKHNETHLLINTLPATYSDQECLISHTISCHSEEQLINDLVKQYTLDKTIIIYGKMQPIVRRIRNTNNYADSDFTMY